jgi:hypothetical protein
MLLNIAVSEKLKNFLLVLLDFVDDWDQKDDWEEHRARSSDEKIKEGVKAALTVLIRLSDDSLWWTVQSYQNTVETILHHKVSCRLHICDGI